MTKFETLINFRNEKGFSQEDMAKKLSVSIPYYCQVENRKRRLSYKTAFLISQILECKPDDIFYDDVKKYNGENNLK